MLNLTLVQKVNLIFTVVCFSKCTSQGVEKLWLTLLCKYIKRKTKYNKGVTRTEDCVVTSHSIMLIVVRCSPTQFYICQKTWCGKRYFLSFETENWKCWLLRNYLNFSCELNFIVNIFLMHHHEQEIVQIFTQMKLTNQTLLTTKLY